ncbi:MULTISPECIES: membrane protein [Streptomyces]|uniref:Membrane protein n=1 Tax=Streptomyces viridochromogenes TaxID=1938 RepID=A0A0L8J757_STRVR|nr:MULTISPECIES: membrane protein [Streptomyces]KOG09470.1 membrane protein [Streptomyces viridochromogenes]
MAGVSGTGSVVGEEWGARAAHSRALAVLRVRGRALGLAVIPAAVAVVLYAGGVTGHFTGPAWDTARWVVTVLAVLVLLAATAVALVVARARPAATPTVELAETAAPDLYRLVRDLADRLDVPAPAGIALTPDCDSWLEDRTHRAHRALRTAHGGDGAPVLVIGSPFLWWMRVAELRAVLAPVVAGTGPAAQPDIAAARRFVRGLDAAVAVPDDPGLDPIRRLGAHGVGRMARVLLRACRGHAAEMERGVAAAGSERAQAVDYGVRIVAQEQVGLAYAGWDRLLTRVALPAWRMGRWPAKLDAGVVSALTELSRRDRLAEGFSSRLGERPACDLLEEPGAVDEATSLLAARLFHGGPAEAGPDWSPVEWSQYPEEVVDRKWRTDAARLHQVLDGLGVPDSAAGPASDAVGPTLTRVIAHLTTERPPGPADPEPDAADVTGPAHPELDGTGAVDPDPDTADVTGADQLGALDDDEPVNPAAEALAGALSALLVREEAAREARVAAAAESARSAEKSRKAAPAAVAVSGPDGPLPLFPLQPPRTGRDLLADHVTAMVCCAAVDTAEAVPGLDWLDGPTLLVGGERAADLGLRVLALVEDGDPEPLSVWLARTGVRPEKPVRLV